nr:hypothetical protein [uncultured Oscillibacter sp.]
MLIHIMTTEKGWDTERHIEVPDNDKLLQALLRTVKRYENAPRGGVTENQPPAETPPAEEPAPLPEPPAGMHFEEPGYRGFLLIRCEACGKVYAYNAREETQEFACRDCGHVTPLRDIAVAELRCPDCKKSWVYKTNLTDAEVFCGCIACGADMRSQWSTKLKRYAPQG